MMAAAAGATSTVLGEEVEISTPEVRDIETVADAVALGEGAPHATGVDAHARRRAVPARAARPEGVRPEDDARARRPRARSSSPAATATDAAAEAGPDEILRGVPLRVCAEIGRATMPMADAVSLPDGRAHRARPRRRRARRRPRQRPPLRDRPARARRRRVGRPHRGGPPRRIRSSPDHVNLDREELTTWHECSSWTTPRSCARW